MSDELKPCPFCNGTALLDSAAHIVLCDGCDCETRSYATSAEAIAAWNRRAGAWMPIESAPRDEWVLACLSNLAVHKMIFRHSYWTYEDGGTCPYQPIGWQPLPEPPSGKEGA